MKLLDKEFKVLISNSKIQEKILELANQITKDLSSKDPIIIVVLNGAFMFASDLIKELHFPCQVSFVKVSSYTGTKSTGKIQNIIGLQEGLKDREVLIIDDIIDSGLTMAFLIDEVKKSSPSNVSVATCLLKPDAFSNQFFVNYIGFPIANDFVVGYGLDYNGYGRNLKDIYILKS